MNRIKDLINKLTEDNKHVTRRSGYTPRSLVGLDLKDMTEKQVRSIVPIIQSSKRPEVMVGKILQEYNIREPLHIYINKNMSSRPTYPKNTNVYKGDMREILNSYDPGRGDLVYARSCYSDDDLMQLSEWVNSFSWAEYRQEDYRYPWKTLYYGISGLDVGKIRQTQPLPLIISILACEDLPAAINDLDDLVCPA